jgi:hypothetical protein
MDRPRLGYLRVLVRRKRADREVGKKCVAKLVLRASRANPLSCSRLSLLVMPQAMVQEIFELRRFVVDGQGAQGKTPISVRMRCRIGQNNDLLAGSPGVEPLEHTEAGASFQEKVQNCQTPGALMAVQPCNRLRLSFGCADNIGITDAVDGLSDAVSEPGVVLDEKDR